MTTTTTTCGGCLRIHESRSKCAKSHIIRREIESEPHRGSSGQERERERGGAGHGGVASSDLALCIVANTAEISN